MIRNNSEFSKGHLQSSPEDDGLSKRAFLKAVAFACLGIGPFVNACGIVNSADTNPGAVKESEGPARSGSAPKAARPPIDLAAPAKTETVTFALGWFWGVEAQFGAIKGVIRTRVGYAGGTKKNPTYHSLGDHSEAIQIDFDPSQLSYEKLLEIFWAAHDPTARSWSRQYKAALFFNDDAQQKLAIETRDREAARRKTRIFTEILPFTGFFLAEGYHQKYSLRQESDLMREFNAMYPQERDFINSTAAARANGYLAGYGVYENLLSEVSGFGLSPEETRKLLDRVRKVHRWPLY